MDTGRQKKCNATDDSENVFNNTIPDDVTSIISVIDPRTIKTSVFLFILFILVSSDVFIDRVLSSADNAYAEGRTCTQKGTLAQGLVIAIGFIIIHTLITKDYI